MEVVTFFKNQEVKQTQTKTKGTVITCAITIFKFQHNTNYLV